MNLKRINGELTLHGQRITDLKQQYKTPLFIYDEVMIRNQCRRFHECLKASGLKYHISYASKAFTSIQLFKLMQEEQMGLDVVSLGELYTALKAGFNAQQIHFHGNNKTAEEIEFAIHSGVEYFVIDALSEIDTIQKIAKAKNKIIKAVLRVNPGVTAHTHEFIQTGQEDSKFGLSIKNDQALQAVKKIKNADNITWYGIHFHIGSQIFESTGTIETIYIVFDWLRQHNIDIQVLNIGGGFSIRYTDEDVAYPIESNIKKITSAIKDAAQKYQYAIPEIALEPGRSIVGEAGMTIYDVGVIKTIPNVNTYVSVDGGMSDHIRTALYQAKYELELVENDDQKDMRCTVAGKLCESGDIIQKNILLPSSIKTGQTLLVKSTGAYHYSMSSNYNQMLKPAVVFVNETTNRLVIKRQSLEHLIANDIL